jgi:hypothetical protein
VIVILDIVMLCYGIVIQNLLPWLTTRCQDSELKLADFGLAIYVRPGVVHLFCSAALFRSKNTEM